jgi:hypothetical protein
LIQARKDLNESDLQEVQFETQIEVASKQIMTKTNQEEKVKEEMKALKAGKDNNLINFR